MVERDPYDYSALAPDMDFGDDSQSVLGGSEDGLAGHQFVLSQEIEEDIDFELELEALGGEAGGLPEGDDAQLRQFQETLQRLSESLVDPQLEADEAWLEALLLEDGESAPGPANIGDLLEGFKGLPGADSLFDDLLDEEL